MKKIKNTFILLLELFKICVAALAYIILGNYICPDGKECFGIKCKCYQENCRCSLVDIGKELKERAEKLANNNG